MSAAVFKCIVVALVLQQVIAGDHQRRGKELLDTEDSDFFRCKQATRKSCCGPENSMKRFGDKDKTAADQCYAEVAEKFASTAGVTPKQDLFSTEAVKITKKKQFCLHECIGKKNKLLTEDGSLNKTFITDYSMNTIFKEQWQKQVGEKALAKCLEETYIPWPTEETEYKCNPVYVQFQHCLWLEYESNCPDDKRKTNKKCEKTRNRYRMQKSSSK
ncbi:Pheromone/general odorant binding protein [Cinara cedri]|uniref:Pheromone/general odorant binding protein n=1 Tax=Cinara cedri TaxID=506608 RepID=A0A5E4M0G6_9HEMI|nr:Pheromone/general odorant binding protein [Cinara cedri]